MASQGPEAYGWGGLIRRVTSRTDDGTEAGGYRIPGACRGERRRAGPGDRGERLRKGRNARRGLPPSEVPAVGLSAEPELDLHRRRGGRKNADRGHKAMPGRRPSDRDDERQEHERDAAHDGFDLGAHDPARRHRRGRDQFGRILARDREPGEPAGKLARRHHQHRHQHGQRAFAGAIGAPEQERRAAADRGSASAIARPARGRAAAAAIPSAAAHGRGSRDGSSVDMACRRVVAGAETPLAACAHSPSCRANRKIEPISSRRLRAEHRR